MDNISNIIQLNHSNHLEKFEVVEARTFLDKMNVELKKRETQYNIIKPQGSYSLVLITNL